MYRMTDIKGKEEKGLNVMKDIKTVQDLIEVLQEYPADMPITYDYGLGIELIEIGEGEDKQLTISYFDSSKSEQESTIQKKSRKMA